MAQVAETLQVKPRRYQQELFEDALRENVGCACFRCHHSVTRKSAARCACLLKLGNSDILRTIWLYYVR